MSDWLGSHLKSWADARSWATAALAVSKPPMQMPRMISTDSGRLPCVCSMCMECGLTSPPCRHAWVALSIITQAACSKWLLPEVIS